MHLWQVSYPPTKDNTLVNEWCATKRQAERLAREGNGGFRRRDVPRTKAGLIEFLNKETP